MCLAVMGKVKYVENYHALVDIEGNIVSVNIQLTPEVSEGQYVLIHAGFAITIMGDDEVSQRQVLLSEISSKLLDV